MKVNCKDFQLVIFDLDGTLVDSRFEIHRAVEETLKLRSYPSISLEVISAMLGKHPSEFFSLVSENQSVINNLVLDFRKLLSTSNFENTKLFPGSLDLLKTLKSTGVNTAVATTKPTTLARQTCIQLGLSPYLDFIQGTDDFDSKPDPEVINRCLRHFNVEFALMVGDTEDDIYAAHAARIPVVALDHGARSREILLEANPTELVSSIITLTERLGK